MKKSDYKQQIEDMSAEINQLLHRNAGLTDGLKAAKEAMKENLATVEKMATNYENQLKVQDKELARRLTIIHYLEDRLNEIIKADK